MKKINKFQKQQSIDWRAIIKCKTSKEGFSLIEVLISLFVLSIGLVAISTLMLRNIRNAEDVRDQIIASELAQEGIELVRSLKDGNKLNTSRFTPATPTETLQLWSLTIDVDSADLSTLDNRLYLNSNNFYTHATTSGVSTKFFRRIDLSISGVYDSDPTISKRVITVNSYVTWNDSGFGTINVCTIGNKCVGVTSVMNDLDYLILP